MRSFIKLLLGVMVIYTGFHILMLSSCAEDSERLSQLSLSPRRLTVAELMQSDWKSQPRITLTNIRIGTKVIRVNDQSNQYWFRTYFLVYDASKPDSGNSVIAIVCTSVTKVHEATAYSSQSEITGIVKGRLATQFIPSVRATLEKAVPNIDVGNILLIDDRPLPTAADVQQQRQIAMILGTWWVVCFLIWMISSRLGRGMLLAPYFATKELLKIYAEQRSKTAKIP